MQSEIKKPVILLVDDSPQNIDILKEILGFLYTIKAATSGEKGLKILFSQKQPDLVLLDIQLPKMNGYQICKMLKSNTETADIPVIFISALTQTLDKVKAFKAGAVDYIEKPFQREEVLARVNAHIIRQKQKVKLEDALQQLKKTQSQIVQSEKMASLGVLSAGIAHEINNPVNFIYAGINSLDQDYADIEPILSTINEITADNSTDLDKLKKLKKKINLGEILTSVPQTIADIKYGAERTAEIIKGLRNFSHASPDAQQIVNIHEIIDSTLLLLNNRIKKGITIEKEYDKKIKAIKVLTGELKQVFMNILNNAIDACVDYRANNKKKNYKAKIKIKTVKQKKHVVISISDNGFGIPEENKYAIFDPF